MLNFFIGKIKGWEIRPNKNAGTASRLFRAQVTGKDDLQTVEQLRQAGIDSGPRDDSVAYVIPLSKAWKVAVGVNDLIAPEATAGQLILYGSDPLTGLKTSQIKLNPNGTVSIGTAAAELLSLFNDNLTEVINALNYIKDDITFSNGGGPTGPPSNAALLVPIIANLTATQTLLGTIKA